MHTLYNVTSNYIFILVEYRHRILFLAQENMGNVFKKKVNFESLPSGKVVRGEKAHFTIKTTGMDPKVLEFILEDEWLQKSDQELLKCGFNKTVDNPYLDANYYLEGYFHGLEENTTISSLNPRRIPFRQIEKPAAPPRLRAFIRATQQKNQHILSRISECFEENSTMKQLAEQGNMFCDVAIQIRYGTEVTYEHVNWHLDTFNSMLHMALSLQGSRQLYAKKVKEDGSSKVYCNTQTPGDVYLSSPAAFKHAVGHKTVRREDRIVAIQCRILMTLDEYSNILSEYVMKPEHPRIALDKIANLLVEQTFVLPDLKEIISATPNSIAELFVK